jgi:hypothetical protein
MAKVLRARAFLQSVLEAVHFAMDTTFSQLSGDLHVASHTKVSGYACPQHGSAAAGENQE